MLDGGEGRLGREQAFLQQRLEQNSSHLARAQDCYSFSGKIETHRAVSSVCYVFAIVQFHAAVARAGIVWGWVGACPERCRRDLSRSSIARLGFWRTLKRR